MTFPENTDLKVSEIMRPRDTDIPGTWYLEMCKSGDDWVAQFKHPWKNSYILVHKKIEQHGFMPLARQLSSTQHKTDAGIPEFSQSL